jgi:glycosyltransferase involved in cell wall biosynthesis
MSAVEARSPDVSVVVPTRNRAELLPPLADALAAQEGVEAYEVIFVDDGSTDGTADVVRRLEATSGIAVRLLRTDSGKRGRAAARNLGWRNARAPLIAFTDDDCLPEPGWLAALVRGLAGSDLVQGLTEVDARQLHGSGPFARFIVITEFSWKFETCNVAYRRELLERLGGFDPAFKHLGEDADLGCRAVELRAKARWCPDAVVIHRVEHSGSRLTDWLNWIRYAQRCESAALIVKRNPSWRSHLFVRSFYKSYHAYTLGVLGAIVFGPRKPAATVLALPWLLYRVAIEPRPARRRWLGAVLPMTFVVDAAEVVATIRGAIRFRTFLL